MSWPGFWSAVIAGCLMLPTASARAQFTEVGGGVGLSFDSLTSGGLTWADFNGDGWLDVLVNANPDGRLYFSSGVPNPTFMNVTDTHAPGLTRDVAERAAVAADLNNDGHTDFIRTNVDLIEVYLNRGPDGIPPFSFGDAGDPDFFRDSATHGVGPEGIGVLDFDGDGFLDIVADDAGELDLYRNPADGTAAFVLVDGTTTGLPLGSAMTVNSDYLTVVDFNVDGFVDVATRQEVLEELWRNQGDGTFAVIPSPNLLGPNNNKGAIVFCDFNADELFDFFFTDGEGPGVNRVWLQRSADVFEDSGEPSITSSAVEGAACGDVDNDGDTDLFLGLRGEADQLWINRLAETGALGWERDDRGIDNADTGLGAVLVDYDRDGDLDLYVNRTGTRFDSGTMMTVRDGRPNHLWRNGTDDDRYLAVRVLAEVQGCPDRIQRDDHGAVLSLRDPASGWRSGVREINGGDGRGTQGSPVAHFGLPMGAATPYELTIRFQHGSAPDAMLRVTPGAIGGYQALAIDASDPDGDSIPTSVEMADAGASPDLDGDGVPAWHDTDADGDGLPDLLEAGDADPCTAPVDADGSGVADYLEGEVLPPTDGGVPPGDASTITDAGDGGGGPPGLNAHGSGLFACSASKPFRGRAAGWSLTLLAIALLRRRRERR